MQQTNQYLNIIEVYLAGTACSYPEFLFWFPNSQTRCVSVD